MTSLPVIPAQAGIQGGREDCPTTFRLPWIPAQALGDAQISRWSDGTRLTVLVLL
jgi:hypothetical protein